MDPLSVMHRIRKDVPVVKYAAGLVGVAAAIAAISHFIGQDESAVRIMGFALAGMVVLMVLSVAEKNSEALQRPAKALIWIVVAAFSMFVIMTVSAFLFEAPCGWVRFLQVADYGVCEPGPSRVDETVADPSAVVPRNKSPALE